MSKKCVLTINDNNNLAGMILEDASTDEVMIVDELSAPSKWDE